jgi:hypothetical protein
MRNFRKAAVVLAASGLAAFGAMAAGTGVANAATNSSLTGCDLSGSLLTLNVTPTCTATTSTVLDPTSIKITADTSLLNALDLAPGIDAVLSLLGISLGEEVTYTVTCTVDGHPAVYNGSFDANGGSASVTKTVDLATAVGSPEPGSCTVSNLKASSLIALNSALLGLLTGGNSLTFGVKATADTAVPGAIWTQAGTTSKGVNADVCVDDASNGNHGSKIQAYQCNSDLAQYWVYTADGQLVHNGDCLDLSGNSVVLNACSGGSAQQWTVNGTNGHKGTIVNQSTNQCLTAPSATNGTQFKIAACGGSNQSWIGPNQSAA